MGERELSLSHPRSKRWEYLAARRIGLWPPYRLTCYLISDNAARPRQGRARPLVGAHGSRSKARSLSHYFGIFESELNGVSKRAPRPLPTYPRCHAEVVGGWSSRMPGWSRHVPCGMWACWRLIQHSHSSRSPSYLPKFRNRLTRFAISCVVARPGSWSGCRPLGHVSKCILIRHLWP